MARPAPGQDDHIGRSPGSRVAASSGLPKTPIDVSVAIPTSLTAYSCGGSRRVDRGLTAFPFNPMEKSPSKPKQILPSACRGFVKVNGWPRIVGVDQNSLRDAMLIQISTTAFATRYQRPVICLYKDERVCHRPQVYQVLKESCAANPSQELSMLCSVSCVSHKN